MPNRVRHYRHEALLSQEELATLVGVQRAQVARIEAGTRNASWRTRRLLAGALGVSEADLFPAHREGHP